MGAIRDKLDGHNIYEVEDCGSTMPDMMTSGCGNGEMYIPVNDVTGVNLSRDLFRTSVRGAKEAPSVPTIAAKVVKSEIGSDTKCHAKIGSNTGLLGKATK
jgi:hypothetical protein